MSHRVLFAAAALAVAPLAHGGLVHHWSLNEIAGSAAIDAVGGADGALGGVSSWSTGRIGNGFKTSGSTLGYVNNGNVPITSTFALSFWVNPEDVSLDWRNMVSKHDGAAGAKSFWIGQKDSDGHMRFGMYFDGSTEMTLDTPYPVIGSGQWALITAMWNESTKTQSLYVNGELAASALRGGQSFLFPRSSNLLFSTNHTSTSNVVGSGSWARFPGTLDDVAIWSAPLAPGEMKAMFNAPAVTAIAHYDAADFKDLFFAHNTNFAIEIGDKRWSRATALTLGEGSVAAVANGHVVQFSAGGSGVTALSKVSLTADPLYANLAADSKIDIQDGPAGRISEIDVLTATESIGSANFRPFQTTTGDVWAMLWLTDLGGIDDRATLRAEIAAVGGSRYDLLNSTDPEWAQLQINHAGFDTLIRFNDVEIGGAFNWDFASHTDVRIDQIAIMTSATAVPEPAAGGVMVLCALAARRGRRHA